MPTLQIQHRVADFETWKARAFDADPLGRATAGVQRHRISRAADDPNYVVIDLEFESMPEAERMHKALQNLWLNPLAAIESPTARILETVEATDY